MNIKKETSFNHQVYQKAYTRLKLTSTERIILQRLLGFLIRNDKPFPYSVISMAKLTALDKRTIFRALNKLEHYRLIERIGMGKNRRFIRGSMLSKILTTVTNRINKNLYKNISTATLCHQNMTNRDTMSYRKTSLSLKHKEEKILFNTKYHEYVKRIEADIELKLIDFDKKILSFDEWKICYN